MLRRVMCLLTMAAFAARIGMLMMFVVLVLVCGQCMDSSLANKSCLEALSVHGVTLLVLTKFKFISLPILSGFLVVQWCHYHPLPSS